MSVLVDVMCKEGCIIWRRWEKLVVAAVSYYVSMADEWVVSSLAQWREN